MKKLNNGVVPPVLPSESEHIRIAKERKAATIMNTIVWRVEATGAPVAAAPFVEPAVLTRSSRPRACSV